MATKRLNLGCGRDYRDGWDNWDISKEVKADFYFDITKRRWPSKDEEYDEIYCSGVLEQVLENRDLVDVMNECWRVLKNGGTMTIIVPNAKYSNAFRDPHDVRQFTPETFEYFRDGSKPYHLYGSVYGYKPWGIKSIYTNERGIMTVNLYK